MNKRKKIISYSIGYAISALIAFLTYYITLPALNLQSMGFYFFLSFVLILGFLPVLILSVDRAWLRDFLERMASGNTHNKKKIAKRDSGDIVFKRKSSKKFIIMISCALTPIVVLIIGAIISSTLFNARAFANVISVAEAKFEEDMPETEKVTNIALMDTNTAKIVGSRTLGSLSDVVSQYEISNEYNQINYKGTPKKVANLEYAGFFKWIGNKNRGIPGYVMVDPVSNNAEYVELSSPLKYVESGFFGDDLMRKLRFSYPTKILGAPRYELDDNGAPVFIVPCYKPQVMMFGAKDVSEVIIFDPCTGSSQIYSLSETPSWIDVVYDGYLACEKYDWKGIYSGGFINSIIGNKDCKQTTDDFGYVMIGDDVWYYTGVTSVNSDKSNIGFILSNARTGEYKFYPVIGAEEHSAMAAAEGEVQEKGYIASFPVLVNIEGKATYIMVLKDAGGLVKLYALVNVEKYSIVATGANQQEAMNEYKRLLTEEGIIDSAEPDNDGTKVFNITVTDIRIATVNGEGVIYISADVDGQNCVFRKAISEDESLMLIEIGDAITVNAKETETDRIYSINSWS